jgi:hypothetical protein
MCHQEGKTAGRKDVKNRYVSVAGIDFGGR